MGSKKTPAQGKGKSLIEFVRDKKRAKCPVCQLPPDVLEEIKLSREKKIPRMVVIEWLQKEHGIKITSADLDGHHAGRHVLNGY